MVADPPTDEDFRWIGHTDNEVSLLRYCTDEVRRTVYELALEELMQA